MTENFEIEALEYLLEEMPPERRAAFEASVAGDPGSQQALKACADALAHFACDAAPAEPMSAADQQAVLATILAATSASGPSAARSAPAGLAWSRWTWPIAAALLLGLNVYQLVRTPFDSVPPNQSSVEPGVSRVDWHDAPRVPATAGGEEAPDPGATQEEVPQGSRFTGARERSSGTVVGAESAQLEQLRRDYAQLQRSNESLRAEYNDMLRVIADRAALERTTGRLATMELVDAASYARGDRKGLMEVARGILAEPGVVVADISTNPTVDPGTGLSGAVVDGSTISPGTVDSGNLATTAAADAPYAWSVFDDKEHRGYLNLYNVPTLAAGQSLQLWVKTIDSSTYQRVGEVPVPTGGGNGSVSYNLPAATTAPVEILITREPRANVGAEPSGPVILRGP